MSVKLFEVDVSDKVLPQGGDSAQQSLDQVLARSITYELADSRGQYSPFLSIGYLGSVNWRDEDIVEQNTIAGRNFAGQIRDVGLTVDNSGYKTYIQALDNVAAFLDAQVIVGTTASATTTNTSHAGDDHFHITSSTVEKNDIIYFGAEIVPQYRITLLHTSTATIDRPLEKDIPNGTTYYYTRPVSKTISEHLFDALTTLIPELTRYGSSWSSFNSLDSGKNLTVFLTAADAMTFRDYISQLLTLGAFQLTVSDSGVIDITRSRNWNGQAIGQQFTLDEIIGPYKVSFDTSGTFEKFQVPYLESTAEVQINTSIETADSAVIATYKNRGVFSPLQIATGESAQYNLIFSDAASADYYLSVYKENYSYPRITIQCSAKAFPSGQPSNPFQIVLGQPFLVSIPLSVNDSFIQEPAIVTGYTIERETQLISSLSLMLTNRLYPNTARAIDTQPVMTSAAGVGSQKLRIAANPGVYLVKVRNFFTKEFVYESEVYCPVDITINAPLSEYEVQLVSNSRTYKTEFERFTLT